MSSDDLSSEKAVDSYERFEPVDYQRDSHIAFQLQIEKVDRLSRVWIAAMQLPISDPADVAVLDTLRHELKVALQETTYDKCIKAFAVAELACSKSDE
jgi:hypothetical protein